MKIRTKRHICLAISCIGFMTVLGAVGGLEIGSLSMGKGITLMLVGFIVSVAAAYKGGYFRR